jgi:hypothetical protein
VERGQFLVGGLAGLGIVEVGTGTPLESDSSTHWGEALRTGCVDPSARYGKAAVGWATCGSKTQQDLMVETAHSMVLSGVQFATTASASICRRILLRGTVGGTRDRFAQWR